MYVIYRLDVQTCRQRQRSIPEAISPSDRYRDFCLEKEKNGLAHDRWHKRSDSVPWSSPVCCHRLIEVPNTNWPVLASHSWDDTHAARSDRIAQRLNPAFRTARWKLIQDMMESSMCPWLDVNSVQPGRRDGWSAHGSEVCSYLLVSWPSRYTMYMPEAGWNRHLCPALTYRIMTGHSKYVR